MPILTLDQTTSPDDVAQAVVRLFGRLEGARGTWEAHWEEIAELLVPEHSSLFQTAENMTGMDKGRKKRQKVFDATPQLGLFKYVSILESLLTPGDQTWHRVTSANPSLAQDREVVLWFEEVTRILFKMRYAPDAGFVAQNQGVFQSVGAYGTGVMFIDELAGGLGLRYKNVFLAEAFPLTNHQGRINGLIRRFALTLRQAEEQWGDRLPEDMREKLKVNPDEEALFLHAVLPNEDVDFERSDFRGKPFSSFYVALKERRLLQQGGFDTFPYVVSRDQPAPNEVYGRGAGMRALPAIKTLMEQKKTVLKQGQRTVDPVLLAHDDGVLAGFNLRPGALNVGGVNRDGRPLIHTLPVGRVDIGKDLMDDERRLIDEGFLATYFQFLVENPQMTATEALERVKEKFTLLGPAIGRQQSEYLGPMIERELDIIARQGLLPPPPEAIEEAVDFTIEYESPLSRSQKAEEVAGFGRSVEEARELAAMTGDVSHLDHFNFDVAIPETASLRGTPQRWLNSDQARAEIRQRRQEQADVQQAIEAAPGAAAVMNAGTKAQQGGG